jgi:DNA-binding response OmpR family regulator
MQRILVAEDDPVLSMIYEITLTEAGFDVLLCQDGQAASTPWTASRPTW